MRICATNTVDLTAHDAPTKSNPRKRGGDHCISNALSTTNFQQCQPRLGYMDNLLMTCRPRALEETKLEKKTTRTLETILERNMQMQYKRCTDRRERPTETMNQWTRKPRKRHRMELRNNPRCCMAGTAGGRTPDFAKMHLHTNRKATNRRCEWMQQFWTSNCLSLRLHSNARETAGVYWTRFK